MRIYKISLFHVKINISYLSLKGDFDMKFLKILISTIIGLLMIIGVVLVYFTVREYRPQDEETMTVRNNSDLEVILNEEISILTFNIGYAGLGINEDFVMDGGKKGRPDNKEVVRGYLDGIKDILTTVDADIFLLQEVDKPSRRSYYINQVDELSELFSNYDKVFSYNYLADFVPFPFSFTDYMGKVASGIQTLSKYKISESIRYQTPGGFSWPVRTVNLKRAIQVNYLPIKDSDKELVIINLHLSAYDDGEMKKAETIFLAEEILKREIEKGNYVIAGGDFNQTHPDVIDNYPVPTENNLWKPSIFDIDVLPDGFQFIYSETATCRSLDKPLEDPENHYYYIIDGFIISNNIEKTSFENLNKGFLYSDHEPLLLNIKLIP